MQNLPLRLVLGLWLLLALASCEPEDLVVTVSLAEIPADTQVVEAVVRIGGVEGVPERIARDQAGYFGLRLPADATGSVAIELSGLDGKDCVIGRVTLSADLTQERRIRLTSPLPALEPQLCRLAVQISGEGQLAVEPAASCRKRGESCLYELARGSTVKLDARAGSGSRFDRWSSPCGQPGPCVLTLNESQPPLELSFAPLICSADKVCWANPLPLGQNLNGAWAGTDGTAWVVGDGGTILRFDGKQWRGVPSGVSKRLLGVWAAGPDAAWAIGEGPTLLRLSGSSWAPDPQVPMRLFDHLHSIWGASASRVWTVGTNGTVLRWNGTTWQQISSGTNNNLYAVTGTSETEVWAVGDGGSVLFFNGTTWKTIPTGSAETLFGVAVLEPGRILAVGRAGTVLRCSTAGCSLLPKVTDEILRAVTVADSAGWIVGDNGISLLLARGADTVTRIDSPTTASLRGAATGAQSLAVGTGGALLRIENKAWTSIGRFTSDAIGSVFASGERDVRALTLRGDLLRWNGYVWATEAPAAMPSSQGRFLRGAVGNDLLQLSQDGTLVHLVDGRSVQPAPKLPVPSVAGLSIPAAQAAYAITQNPPALYRFDGTAWTELTRTVSSDSFSGKIPQGLFAPDRDTVFVPCSNGFIARGDIIGNQVQWRFSQISFLVTLTSIWGASKTELWAVGESGMTVLSRDGVTWNRVFTDATSALLSIHGSSRSNVFAVGANGTVMYFNGTQWAPKKSGTNQMLRDVRVLPSGAALAVGDSGSILQIF